MARRRRRRRQEGPLDRRGPPGGPPPASGVGAVLDDPARGPVKVRATAHALARLRQRIPASREASIEQAFADTISRCYLDGSGPPWLAGRTREDALAYAYDERLCFPLVSTPDGAYLATTCLVREDA